MVDSEGEQRRNTEEGRSKMRQGVGSDRNYGRFDWWVGPGTDSGGGEQVGLKSAIEFGKSHQNRATVELPVYLGAACACSWGQSFLHSNKLYRIKCMQNLGIVGLCWVLWCRVDIYLSRELVSRIHCRIERGKSLRAQAQLSWSSDGRSR
jgi:hypothetical protein